MAKEKRIIIPGLNLLTSLNEDWGGENNTGEAITMYGTEIPDGYKWAMNFAEVERFIKGMFRDVAAYTSSVEGLIAAVRAQKIGCLRTWEDDEEELHLLGFASVAEYEDWLENPELVPPITDIIIPKGGGAESAYSLTLEGTAPAAVQMTNDFTVRLKAVYLYNSGGAAQEVPDWVTLTVQRLDNSQRWVTCGRFTVQTNRFNYISMKGILPSGNVQVRITATAEKATTAIPFTFQVNIVNMTLKPATAFQVPFEQGDLLNLQYYITGNVSKSLILKFDGGGTGKELVIDGITHNDTDVPYTCEVRGLTDILTAGLHTVEAQLKYNDDLATEWVESEYLVNGVDAPVVSVNNISEGLANWTDVHFFDWSVLTPDGEALNVIMRLVDANNRSTEYARWPFSGEPRYKYPFTTQLAIDGVSDSWIDAVMLIEDSEGNELHEPVAFGLENEASFAPTPGANFVLSPAVRSNAETAPATIINTVNGETVQAEFEGFDFSTDGWKETTYEGSTVRVLRIPAGRRLTIHYNPMADFTGADNTGRSFAWEMDFVVDNIVDDEEPLVELGSLRSSGVWWGFRMMPSRAMLLTANKYTEPDQDLAWAEGKRFHLVITAQYGGEGAPNIVRMFLNGRLEREFAYDNDDRFTAEDVVLRIGNTSSDIDIFGMRGLRQALSSSGAMQDYKASMSTTAEKIAFEAANDILDDRGRISWDKCLGKYNIIGHRGPLLHKGMENNTQHGISLEIHMPDDEEHSGTLTNLDNKGQGTTAMTYYWWNQQYKTTDETQLLDDEGNPKGETGAGYAIQAQEYPATKLVGKVNFASSMQSHKLGLTKAYTDVFKQMIKDGNMSTPGQFATYPDARLAVLEKPFLFFVWDEANGRWEFQNLMTFGAGKGDKPTFGFNKNTTGHMLMVEGADNDVPLARFNMPWDDTNVTYDIDKEAWMYNGAKNINFGFGKTTDDIPSDTDALTSMRNFFNFVYQHSTKIEFFNGSLDALQRTEGSRLSPQRWLTGTYDLYRYDEKTGRWVPAGPDNTRLNLVEQYEYFTGEAFNTSQSNQAKNEAFKKARLEHFKAHAAEYFHIDDALYHYCFIKLIAGTDNRCKNTYYYTDPVTLKIRWMQDDVDTVLKTNNVGQNRKPYWVEEHTKDGSGENYWQAEESTFYCLLEEAWDRDTPETGQPNIQQTMRQMLAAMSTLGGGSVMGFFVAYLLAVPDYFPAVAYNEQARAVYEYSYRLQLTGEYSNDTNALSQSCGSQRWSEYQWLVDRIMFISSWCQYGEFASATAAGGLSWRGAKGTHYITVKPAKWMYPRMAVGSSNVGGTALRAPGEAHAFNAVSSEGDTALAIRGNDYLFDLGDMDQFMTVTEFGFTGKRLQQITVNPNGTNSPVRWSAPAVRVNSTNIKRYIHRKTPLASGTLDLSACVRLEEINVEGTSFTAVKLPATGSLTSLTLPATLEALTLVGCKNLETLAIEGYGAMTEVTIRDTPLADSLYIVQQSMGHLNKVDIDNIDWRISGASGLALLNALAALDNCKLQGTITLTAVTPSFEDKAAWLQAWGDVDHGTNGLTIVYSQTTIENVRIITGKYLESLGDHPMRLNSEGNNFSAVEWSISRNGYATIDATTGVVTVYDMDDEVNGPYADVTVKVTRLDGVVLEDTKRFYFCEHVCREGDYVYADGTFSDELVSYKTVIANCFYINPNNPADRLAVSRGDVITDQWGLFDDASYGVTNVTVDGYTSVYDTPVINIQSNGNGDIDNLASMASFATYLTTTAVGDVGLVELTEHIGPFRVGDFIHRGQYKTLQIIRHRNRILNGVTSDVGSHVPQVPVANANQTEREVLTNLIADIVAKKGNNYRQFYYPAASYCYAYQPTYQLQPGEVLADKFKAHNWWLPTLGELGMVYWQQVKGGIFAAAQANSRYSNLTNDLHWTSTEYYASNAWNLHGENGQVYTYIKQGSRAVRAVVAF